MNLQTWYFGGVETRSDRQAIKTVVQPSKQLFVKRKQVNGVFFTGETPMPEGTPMCLYPVIAIKKSIIKGTELFDTIWQFWGEYAIDFYVGSTLYYGIPAAWANNDMITPAQFIEYIKSDQHIISNVTYRPDDEGNTLSVIGHMLNEPPVDQHPNVFFNKVKKREIIECAHNADVIKAYIKVVSNRVINPGEELYWCYGDEYKRNYDSGCPRSL